jgi:hypothetical protein
MFKERKKARCKLCKKDVELIVFYIDEDSL